MDGGVADTTLLLLFNTTRARTHTLRTPKHGNHSRHGRRCGRHNPR